MLDFLVWNSEESWVDTYLPCLQYSDIFIFFLTHYIISQLNMVLFLIHLKLKSIHVIGHSKPQYCPNWISMEESPGHQTFEHIEDLLLVGTTCEAMKWLFLLSWIKRNE